MCIYNELARNPKYKSTKKNGGVIPPINDERVTYIPRKCGKCMECKKATASQWRVRLQEDIRQNRGATFVTLTFNEESLKELSSKAPDIEGYALQNWIATQATRYFLERWRAHDRRERNRGVKIIDPKTGKRIYLAGKSLRHWLITELGHKGTERIHLHGLVWSRDIELIRKIWKYGFVWPTMDAMAKNYVNDKTINYIVKYVTKTDAAHPKYDAIILTTPGIGADYINSYNARRNKYNGEKTITTYKTRTGEEIALPVYWRNKIYTEEEREKLWIFQLNKEQRYVLGLKLDIRNGEQEYNKAVETAREKNKRLGYGNGEKDVDQEQYKRYLQVIRAATKRKKEKQQELRLKPKFDSVKRSASVLQGL